jgi:hypothetical protein
MPVEMNHHIPGIGKAHFRGKLMSDAHVLVYRNAVLPAPFEGLIVERYLFYGLRRDFVVDEHDQLRGIQRGILLHKVQAVIGNAVPIVHGDKVGGQFNRLSGPYLIVAGGGGKYLFN